jgi:hypothetical protein
MATESISHPSLPVRLAAMRVSFGTFRQAFSYFVPAAQNRLPRPAVVPRGRTLEETSMHKSVAILVAGMLAGGGAAYGKLPPPTADEQAAAAAKKAAEQAQLEKEKALLEKAQDRVAARYRSESPGRQAGAGRTSDQNMPRTTSERPRGTGPDPVRPQSAEAHSAPAK